LQQSLLQQDASDWQQLDLQQSLGQHFDPGLQQSAVMASAESEDSVRTKTANIFFMEISFRF
jgi:hypothetical protein